MIIMSVTSIRHVTVLYDARMSNLLYLGIDQVEVSHLVLIQFHGALPRLGLAVVHAVQHLGMWGCPGQQVMQLHVKAQQPSRRPEVLSRILNTTREHGVETVRRSNKPCALHQQVCGF